MEADPRLSMSGPRLSEPVSRLERSRGGGGSGGAGREGGGAWRLGVCTAVSCILLPVPHFVLAGRNTVHEILQRLEEKGGTYLGP
eukprot:1402539-Rhodomonas_salina.3